MIYSRAGLRKMAAQLDVIKAPADFIFFHDCPIRGLRVLEIRPGLLAHDQLFLNPKLQESTDIGIRPVAERRSMSLSGRIRQKLLGQRR